MISPLSYIRRRLSMRLGLLIILAVTVVFALMFNILFHFSKQFVRQLAFDHAMQLLDHTAARIDGIMDETEIVTNYMAATTPRHLKPDSLLSYTRRTVASHDFLTGFAISMEPYYFPEMGRYFSAYSLRQDDTITTVREGPFEYFEKVWYSTPRTLGKACWVEAYDDYNEGTLSARDILISYCCPMRDSEGRYVGSITASLTLKWLSETVTTVKAYPHSSAIMVGHDGTYLIHPDTAKLFRESIFSDADPRAQHDINLLGKAMLAGGSGTVQTIVDDRDAFIFYRPIHRIGGSIAIVCPAIDVFTRYDRLFFIVWAITGTGLIVLLLVCYLTVRRAVQPLSQLAIHARLIAGGRFDDPLPPSRRRDSVGRLTNSFIQMQHSLAQSVADIKAINSQLEQHNRELAEAYRLIVDNNERKAAFIRDMSHQVRTPLNIISGFAQVLAASHHELQGSELDDIIGRMTASAETIGRISQQLSDLSAEDSNQHHI